MQGGTATILCTSFIASVSHRQMPFLPLYFLINVGRSETQVNKREQQDMFMLYIRQDQSSVSHIFGLAYSAQQTVYIDTHLFQLCSQDSYSLLLLQPQPSKVSANETHVTAHLKFLTTLWHLLACHYRHLNQYCVAAARLALQTQGKLQVLAT